jgi:probable rRNA maturation factor
MTFSVALLDEANSGGLASRRATRLVALSFAERGFDPDELGEVSIVLVGPEEMRNLNERFRGKDYPTDVLSFEIDGPEGEMVGEIVLCPEVAEMSLEELVVHGSLHLAGMDHDEEDFETSEMAEIQSKVMEKAREEER